MLPPRKSIHSRIAVAAALGAIAISGMVLAGCGGGGSEGAPPPPATTKAAPARNAAPPPRYFYCEYRIGHPAFDECMLGRRPIQRDSRAWRPHGRNNSDITPTIVNLF